MKDLSKRVDVSVIIPTCGRADDLFRALRALAGAASPARLTWEVLVIDNGMDGSAETAMRRCSPFPVRLRRIEEPTPGLHAARNRGWLEAAGRWLAYLDDDSIPGEEWVRGLEQVQSLSDVALAGGSCRPAYDAPPPPWLDSLWDEADEGRVLWNLSLVEFHPNVGDVPPHLIFGCNLVVRREVLELAEGFHPDGFPRTLIVFRGDGESHVSNTIERHKMRSVCLPNLSITHRVSRHRMTEDYLLQRSFDQGLSDSYAAVRREGKSRPAWRRWSRVMRIAADVRRGGGLPLRHRLALARELGFWAHQRVVCRFPALMEWVTRRSYWGSLASVPVTAFPACEALEMEWGKWKRRLSVLPPAAEQKGVVKQRRGPREVR